MDASTITSYSHFPHQNPQFDTSIETFSSQVRGPGGFLENSLMFQPDFVGPHGYGAAPSFLFVLHPLHL